MTDRSVELRSDTFTRPSPDMRRAMAEAEVGDDVWNEDPTVHRLEEFAAELMGMEAGLFVSSGTQGNLVGILSHTKPGDEIILGDESHIFQYEAAGTAVVGGLQARILPNDARGRLSPAAVRAAIRGVDIHFPRTGCLALENTHNRCGGSVLHPDEIAEAAAVAHAAGVPVHLDGARIFNAAVAVDLPPATLTAGVDSVTFCLSKALGAPVGSVLCGPASYIERARKWRKLLGGGMRQVGVLAAAGLYALNNNVARLAEDQANARALADGLAHIPGIRIDPSTVESNIVYFGVAGDPLRFAEEAARAGVRLAPGPRLRAVTSYEVTRADIDYALQVVNRIARTYQSSPVTV
jgi:threonine aldolase